MSLEQPTYESVVTQRLSFRAGHVVENPHVHDFVVKVTVSQRVAQDGPGAGMGADVLALRQILSTDVASRLGHRMSVWDRESDAVRAQPVDWPKDLAGPVMPWLIWPVRPTVENIGRWIASVVSIRCSTSLPGAEPQRIEVAETRRTSVIFEGRGLLRGLRDERVPGPHLSDST